MSRYEKAVEKHIQAVRDATPDGMALAPVAFAYVQQLDRSILERLATIMLSEAAADRDRSRTRVVEQAATRAVAQVQREQAATSARWAKADAKREETMRELRAELQRSIDEFKTALYVEWTEELLSSEFARPDGTRVTWGDATREDHELRVGMFTDNAMANMAGAARHQQALDELARAGAPNLNALVVGVAA